MVHDIEAVNRFVAAGKASDSSDSTATDDGSSVDTDYISYAMDPLNVPIGTLISFLI